MLKSGVLNEERFFSLLSQHCNYVSPQVIKDFYLGLVRHVTKELRTNGVVRFPHLGDFALVKQKDRLGWNGRYRAILQGKYALKFYPNYNWRNYFVLFSKKDGLEGALDPREKILNKKLDEMS